jgi:hypothetical protein
MRTASSFASAPAVVKKVRQPSPFAQGDMAASASPSSARLSCIIDGAA